MKLINKVNEPGNYKIGMYGERDKEPYPTGSNEACLKLKLFVIQRRNSLNLADTSFGFR